MVKFNEVSQKILDIFKKYKYVVLVVLLGVVLLLIPMGSEKKPARKETPVNGKSDEAYVQEMEQRMEELLSQVDGAGRVKVMLTLRTGSQTKYQMDIQTSSNSGNGDNQNSEERKTVILSEGSAYDKAAISAVDYPQFQGALILSEGAERASVKLELIEAVRALTGLNSSQITVVKLK